MKRIYTLALACFASCGAMAQIFGLPNQFFSAPQALNPALTGATNDLRCATNASFYTYEDRKSPEIRVSADMPILTGKLPKGDALGVGILYEWDHLNGKSLKLSSNIPGLSVAYHKALGKKHASHVSLGTQVVYHHDHFQTIDQFNGFRASGNIDITTFNAGLLYSHRWSNKATISTGYTIQNLTRPFPSVDGADRTNSRHTGFICGLYPVAKLWTLHANAMYGLQNPTEEYSLGAYASVLLGKSGENTHSKTFYFGGSYNYTLYTSVTPYLGFEIGSWKLGISSNRYRSYLGVVTPPVSNVEFSLIYTGHILKGGQTGWSVPKLF